MSHPDIINNCKKITIQYLIDAIGVGNIVSIILYGSVARNEESYKNVNGKLFLESDLDVLVVVKNRTTAIKWLIRLRRLCKDVSDQLRKKWLLSHVNLSITTEDRLLHAHPSNFILHLKLNGKVIFGKELVGLMHSYRYKDIPVPALCRMLFGYMISLVRTIALSGITEGKITIDGYNSILKSIRKLTLFMIRAIIIKDSIPLNPYDLTEIRTKKGLCEIKNSAIFNDLLNSYDDINLSESKGDCSMAEIHKCLVRVINQFNSTIAILIDIKDPFVTLPIKLILGHFPLIRRLEYSMYIFLTNVTTTTIGLLKFIIYIIWGSEQINIRYYDLFVSSPCFMKSAGEVNSDNYQQRKSWLKRYHKTLQPWKYDVVGL